MEQIPRLPILLESLIGPHGVDPQEELAKISDLWSPFVLGSHLEGMYSGVSVSKYPDIPDGTPSSKAKFRRAFVLRNDGTVFVSEWEPESPGQGKWDIVPLP